MTQSDWIKIEAGDYKHRNGQYRISKEWRRLGGEQWILRGPNVSKVGERGFESLKRAMQCASLLITKTQ